MTKKSHWLRNSIIGSTTTLAVLVGVALATGSSHTAATVQHPRDTSVSDNVEQAQLRGTESAFKANQRATAKAADKVVANKAATAPPVAKVTPTPKATKAAAPTPKATKAAPRFTSGDVDCAKFSQYRVSDFASQKDYNTNKAYCESPAAQSNIGMPNDYTKKPATTCVSKFGPGTPGVYPNCYDAEAQTAGRATFENCIKAGKVWDKVNQVCKP